MRAAAAVAAGRRPCSRGAAPACCGVGPAWGAAGCAAAGCAGTGAAGGAAGICTLGSGWLSRTSICSMGSGARLKSSTDNSWRPNLVASACAGCLPASLPAACMALQLAWRSPPQSRRSGSSAPGGPAEPPAAPAPAGLPLPLPPRAAATAPALRLPPAAAPAGEPAAPPRSPPAWRTAAATCRYRLRCRTPGCYRPGQPRPRMA